MPDVQMPDGTVMQGVPEGTSKDEIMMRYTRAMQAQKPQQQEGFISNVKNDMAVRMARQSEINAATSLHPNENQQNALRGTWQSGTNLMGAANDVVGEGVKSLAKTGYENLTTQGFKERQALGLQELGKTEAGKALGRLGEQYNQNKEAFAKETPNFARDVQGMGDFGQFIMPGGGTGNLIKGATKLGIKGAERAVDSSIGTAISDMTKKPVILSTPEIKAISQDSYKEADKVGGVRTPEIRNNLINKLEDSLPSEESVKPGGSIIQDVLDKVKTNAGYTKDKEGNWAEPTTPKPLSLAGAETVDKDLTDLINKEHDIKGHVSNEGRQLQEVQAQFREDLYNPKPEMIVGGQEGFDAYKRGVQQWAAKARMEDIDNIFKRAENKDNQATVIKNGFNSLYTSPSRMRAYPSAEEKAFIKQAATSSKFADYLRTTAGSRLISSVIGTAAGSSFGPIGTMIGAGAGALVGEASRGLATKMQTGRAGKIMQSISNRAVDNGTIKGTLYKYLGKEGGDEAMQSLSQGQIPKSLSKLPSKQANIIIEQIKKGTP